MKKMLVLLTVLCFSLIALPLAKADSLNIDSRNAIAVDLRTGKILFEKNADAVVPVANLSRLLTIYLTYQAVADGQAKWSDQVTISDYAYNLTFEPNISNVPLENSSYSLEELLKASIIAGSTSASVAIAEHISGSEKEFVNQMQLLANEWGLDGALLVNASGINTNLLSNSTPSGTENSLSARQLAIISYHLISDFPEVLEITQATRGNFGGDYIYTYNYLLENMPYARPDAVGLVTGSSETAGSSLISLSYENYMEVLTVVINVNGGLEDSDKRFQITNDFLDKIKDRFFLKKILTAYSNYEDIKAPVLDGKETEVPTIVQDDFYIVGTESTIKNIKLTPTFPPKTNYAPIKEEDVVGSLVYDDPNLIGSGYLYQPPSINLIADGQVERSGLLKILWNHFVVYILENL